jgi:N-acetylmuramoyl-L-alanine amidase
MIKRIKPDYCIAIHHDSNNKKTPNGFGAYYYHPYSKKATELILNHSFNTGIYTNKTFKLHKYFTLRSSVCPVVLTENGYMSNSGDYSKIIDEAINIKKAQALVRGIVEYFTSIQ